MRGGSYGLRVARCGLRGAGFGFSGAGLPAVRMAGYEVQACPPLARRFCGELVWRSNNEEGEGGKKLIVNS